LGSGVSLTLGAVFIAFLSPVQAVDIIDAPGPGYREQSWRLLKSPGPEYLRPIVDLNPASPKATLDGEAVLPEPLTFHEMNGRDRDRWQVEVWESDPGGDFRTRRTFFLPRDPQSLFEYGGELQLPQLPPSLLPPPDGLDYLGTWGFESTAPLTLELR
jgi:hypothetical protein